MSPAKFAVGPLGLVDLYDWQLLALEAAGQRLPTAICAANGSGKTKRVIASFASLLWWEEVRRLQETGIEFGCHSSLHRPMTGMHLQELAEDTVRARAILEAGLATSIKTLAYPYGAENEFVRRAIEDLGFESAVTCDPGISRPGDNPLRLPRIEVSGGCTPKRLLDWIDHAS